MKKKFAVVCFLIALIAAVCAVFAGAGTNGETVNAAYLRVHIRANSNLDCDQSVKYKVRDRVVEYLTPTVASCEDKQTAMNAISQQLDEIAMVADKVLRENGYTYGARAKLKQEEFPTRVYENVTLQAGVYDALILELGTGEGDNWWCVVYPPLCFTSGNGNIVYKSKIAEIIKRFKEE